MFVDLHTHILYNVDDGSKDLDFSLKMLEKQVEEGVYHVVLTPHVKSKVQKATRKEHIARLEELKNAVKEKGLPIHLTLGAEVQYRSHLTPDYKDYTFGNSNYLLVEFSTKEEQPIEEIVYDLSRMGFKVIIAHIERYAYLSLSDMEMIRRTGALIQVNTTSILGLDKAVKAKHVIKMIKLGLVDLISSDCHNLEARCPNMMTCYTFLKKHVEEDVLIKIFNENPKQIIDAIS